MVRLSVQRELQRHTSGVKLEFQVPEIELKVLRDAQRILIEGKLNNI